MGRLQGADVNELRGLAEAFERGATQLSALEQRLRQLIYQFEWDGGRAEQFRSEIHGSITGNFERLISFTLQEATLLRTQADQQDHASWADEQSGAGSGLTGAGDEPTPTTAGTAPWGGLAAESERRARDFAHGVMNSSSKWGWFFTPFLGATDLGAAAIAADQAFRLKQDLKGHYWGQSLVEAGSDGGGLLFSAGLKSGNPVVILGGTDVMLWTDVYDAGRQIDWGYTFGHLNELNPAAPGAMSAVWQAETQGFAKIGKQFWSSL